MRKAKKYVVLGLLSIFVAGNVVFSLASEKSPERIPPKALAIKTDSLLLHKEQTPKFFKPHATNPKISGRLNSLISKKTAQQGKTRKL